MKDAQQLLERLQQWVQCGALRSLDLALSSFIQQQQKQTPAVLLAIALVSERNSHGHVCLDLAAALRQPGNLLGQQPGSGQAQTDLAHLLARLDLSRWVDELAASNAIANHLNGNTTAQQHDTPLVLAGSTSQPLLYLRRYWQYEQQINNAIAQRLQQQRELPAEQTRQLLGQLFAEKAPTGVNWQKTACLLAARNRFAIITGGPGTGKTTTVVKLLALLQGLHNNSLQIHLAAPTGKAAARLSESISGSINRLPLQGAAGLCTRQSIPHEVSTLHRLLGSRPNSRHFHHNQANPLPTDLVVVDEASMMDVEMMAKLVNALPQHAGLILLGDKDQLASVEAGSVLADLCRGAEHAHYQPETAGWLARLGDEKLAGQYIDANGSALQQATCMLRYSYRFNAHPGIGELSAAVNSGRASVEQLQQIIARHPDSLHSFYPGTGNVLDKLASLAVAGYGAFLRCLQQGQPASVDIGQLNQWAKQVFAAHGSFQLLCAMRKTQYGLEQLNTLIEQALQQAGLVRLGGSSWYPGRPVLITRNDYSLRLMNGDIGICMQWPDGSLRVAFADGADGIRWLLPSRLQAVETVFAMTVHKSQGSEFVHTALVLPDHHSPVLTKELIYTAITRSREKFSLFCASNRALQLALETSVQRASGL